MVVSDTSPLNYLAQIGHLGVLPALYGQILIPAGVASELAHPGAPEVVRAMMAAAAPPSSEVWSECWRAPAGILMGWKTRANIC